MLLEALKRPPRAVRIGFIYLTARSIIMSTRAALGISAAPMSMTPSDRSLIPVLDGTSRYKAPAPLSANSARSRRSGAI